MEACVQSSSLTGSCLTCGGRAPKMHRPVFERGSFCPRCCPVCARRPNPTAAIPQHADVPAQGATQLKDGEWGPRRDATGRYVDPWYRDERRFPPPWIPRRPNWFK